jgi:hypothetical protein
VVVIVIVGVVTGAMSLKDWMPRSSGLRPEKMKIAKTTRMISTRFNLRKTNANVTP